MDQGRTLFVLRHAQTEDARPGGRDADRRLTPEGALQARAVGDHLRAEGISLDAVLCSDAVRTRQTLDLLGLPDDRPGPAARTIAAEFYNAGTDTLLAAVRALPDDVRQALLVGHAPGAPGVVYELADRQTSSPSALAAIADRFPAATLARLELTGSWSELDTASLSEVRLPTGA